VSGQLLLLLKFVLLGLLYLFLFRVVRAVWAEINPTRHLDGVPGAAPPAGTQSGGARRRERGPSGVPQSAPPAAAGGAVGRIPPPPMPAPAPFTAPAGPASASGPAPHALFPAALVVVTPPEQAGQQYALEGNEITLGRGGSSTVLLDDAFVSMVHARFRRGADGWLVEDLGSTNGTLLNGAPLLVPSRVAPGDRLVLGGVTLEVR
jgi:hypothetical protein